MGRETFPTSVLAAKPFGKIVTCGATTGYSVDFDVRYLWMRQKEVIGSHAFNAYEAWRANELIAEGRIRPVLWRAMAFGDLPEAHRLIDENRHLGKISIMVGAGDEEEGMDRRLASAPSAPGSSSRRHGAGGLHSGCTMPLQGRFRQGSASLPAALGFAAAVLLLAAAPAAGRGFNRPVCPGPVAHAAGCHARVTDDRSGKPLAGPGPSGLNPAQFHGAYGLPATGPAGQTIAIVDAYDSTDDRERPRR